MKLAILPLLLFLIPADAIAQSVAGSLAAPIRRAQTECLEGLPYKLTATSAGSVVLTRSDRVIGLFVNSGGRLVPARRGGARLSSEERKVSTCVGAVLGRYQLQGGGGGGGDTSRGLPGDPTTNY